MLTKTLSVQSALRAGGIALVAAVAIGAAQPSAAIAAAAHASAVSQPTTLAPTDISAARRQRHVHVRRSTSRDAYGSYAGGAGGVATQSYPGYGYGVGDNSRGQTW